MQHSAGEGRSRTSHRGLTKLSFNKCFTPNPVNLEWRSSDAGLKHVLEPCEHLSISRHPITASQCVAFGPGREHHHGVAMIEDFERLAIVKGTSDTRETNIFIRSVHKVFRLRMLVLATKPEGWNNRCCGRRGVLSTVERNRVFVRYSDHKLSDIFHSKDEK